MSNEKIYGMRFGKIYPLLVSKAEKKGRTLSDVMQVITWLTGYTAEEIEKAAASSLTYGDFFREAPQLNPNRKLITGVVCGVRVETIEEPLMQEIRYLDKLIDELAKGKAMEKILRGQAQVCDADINPNEKTNLFLFFEDHMGAFPLYEKLEERILSEIGNVRIKIQKSQISFYHKHMFTCVSFARIRKKKDCPENYIVVTFGLKDRLESPRIDIATEPYPNRWTHHLLVSRPDEIDEELMGWIKEAAEFAAAK